MKYLFFSIIISLCLTESFAKESKINWADTRVLTEDLPPLSYLDPQTNELKGESVDLIKQVLEIAHTGLQIEVLPWARAYKYAQEHDNILVFNLARTPERENKFQWFFQTAIKKVGVFTTKAPKEIKYTTLTDLAKYRVVVLNQNIAHQELLKEPTLKDKVHPLSNVNSIIPFLFNDHADVWVTTYIDEASLAKQIKELGFDPKRLHKISDIPQFKVKLFLGASLGTSPEKIKILQKSYEEFKKKKTVKDDFAFLNN